MSASRNAGSSCSRTWPLCGRKCLPCETPTPCNGVQHPHGLAWPRPHRGRKLLDYFRATAAAVPDDHLLFRFEHSMSLSTADRLLVRQLSLQLGFPREDGALARSLCGEDSAMTDLFPELATLRDVAFYLKASMVPSLDALP